MAKKMVNSEALLKIYHCDIFRFCDRWCEKCGHTSHCFYYKVITYNDNKEIKIDRKGLEYLINSQDDENSGIKKLGIKLRESSIDSLIESETPPLHSFKSVIYAEKYSNDVNTWFSTLLNCNVDPVNNTYRNASCLKNPMKELKSSIELIRRYQDLIGTKLERAVLFQSKGNETFEKGYAKLSIVLIEKSIKAWIKLLNICTANKERSLKIIKHLEELLIEVKQTFPGASSFYRIGHD